MKKIGHDELQSYMLQHPVKSEDQILAMINFFVQQAVNQVLTDDLGLTAEDDTVQP